MATNDEKKTYVLPSLLKVAYHACNDEQQKWYDKLPVQSADLKICCQSILKIIRLNSDVERFNPHGDRLSMFSKVKPLVQSQFSDDYVIKDICERAAFHGHVECMKLARAIGVPWYSPTLAQKSACDRAAESGNLESLKYAHLNGAQWSVFTCNYAADNGHLDCLVYLHENGCPWNDLTCINAAKNGHFHCLAYARQNNCPWNDAWRHVKFCKENGCLWDVGTCQVAALLGKVECSEYAKNVLTIFIENKNFKFQISIIFCQ